MRGWKNIVFVLFVCLFAGCEDIIDIDLNDADPRIVIESEIINGTNSQTVRVSRTVSFSDVRPYEPVSMAQITISDNLGRQYDFMESEPGVYTTNRLRGMPGMTYTLNVNVDGSEYTAQSTMPTYLTIDSVSSSSGEFFGVSRKALHVHFQDPSDTPNYFGYRMSVNGSEFMNVGVFNDKFNNGRYVTHDLISMDIDLEVGDDIAIQRNQIDENIYRYWYGVLMQNPGAAAPANPPSNISGGALGYFSAQTSITLRMVISDEPAD